LVADNLRRATAMMFLPFLVLALGLGAIAAGRRDLALASWTVGALLLLVLFRMHATDALKIGL
jgi:hypothetical protein